jgi:hypothetical protein
MIEERILQFLEAVIRALIFVLIIILLTYWFAELVTN